MIRERKKAEVLELVGGGGGIAFNNVLRCLRISDSEFVTVINELIDEGKIHLRPNVCNGDPYVMVCPGPPTRK